MSAQPVDQLLQDLVHVPSLFQHPTVPAGRRKIGGASSSRKRRSGGAKRANRRAVLCVVFLWNPFWGPKITNHIKELAFKKTLHGGLAGGGGEDARHHQPADGGGERPHLAADLGLRMALAEQHLAGAQATE